jgi:hypothetical protein
MRVSQENERSISINHVTSNAMCEPSLRNQEPDPYRSIHNPSISIHLELHAQPFHDS